MKIEGPAYAIDDQTAISVVDGNVRIVSEGSWQSFNLESARLDAPGPGRDQAIERR